MKLNELGNILAYNQWSVKVYNFYYCFLFSLYQKMVPNNSYLAGNGLHLVPVLPLPSASYVIFPSLC